MVKPIVNLEGTQSAVEAELQWDMPNTFWDSGLRWDSEVFEAQPLSPVINVLE